jgi:6,7-dimethyl-8-ribityllumazine synthase
VGVVYARWNELAVKPLLEGALDELRRHGASEVVVVEVPGTWEIPPAATALVESGVEALVVLGCILQGATPHAAQLASDVSGALMALQNSTGVPVAWGVLTPETQEQALERAGMKMGNKGREAARTALEMLDVLAKAREALGEAPDR